MVTLPIAITAKLGAAAETDFYKFAARKGQRYLVKAHTVELNSPTEVYMVLKDAKGGQVAASNPTVTASLDFTAPADGDYTLAVEHLLYAGGPSETYRITVEPFEPLQQVARLGTQPGRLRIIGLSTWIHAQTQSLSNALANTCRIDFVAMRFRA